MNHLSHSEIIERAKQQRAEHIGSAIRKHPVATLLVVAVPVLLTLVDWRPSAPVAHGHQIVQLQKEPRRYTPPPPRLANTPGVSSAPSFFSSFLNQ
jgi:hypothetical protein